MDVRYRVVILLVRICSFGHSPREQEGSGVPANLGLLGGSCRLTTFQELPPGQAKLTGPSLPEPCPERFSRST